MKISFKGVQINISVIDILAIAFSLVVVILLIWFANIIGCYLEKTKTPDQFFYSFGVITISSIIVLIFLLWIKKGLLPEELKERNKERLNAEEQDKRANAHQLEIIKAIMCGVEDPKIQIFKAKYEALNQLIEEMKKELNK